MTGTGRRLAAVSCLFDVGGVFGDEFTDFVFESNFVESVDLRLEFIEPLVQFDKVLGGGGVELDAGMFGFLQVLAEVLDLFMELFSRAQAGEANFYVVVRS